MLLKLDAVNVIDAETSESNYKSDPNGNRVKRLNIEQVNDKMISNISHKKEIVAVFALGKLNKSLSNFKGSEKKLSEFETNLLHSFYSSHHFRSKNKNDFLVENTKKDFDGYVKIA